MAILGLVANMCSVVMDWWVGQSTLFNHARDIVAADACISPISVGRRSSASTADPVEDLSF